MRGSRVNSGIQRACLITLHSNKLSKNNKIFSKNFRDFLFVLFVCFISKLKGYHYIYLDRIL